MKTIGLRLEINEDLVWRIYLTLCAVCVLMTSSEVALATTSNPIGDTLCRLVSNLSGSIAKGIATIAIFAVGVGLFLGRVNWGIAALTAAGVGIIFAAPGLVAFLSGDDANSTCEVVGT